MFQPVPLNPLPGFSRSDGAGPVALGPVGSATTASQASIGAGPRPVEAAAGDRPLGESDQPPQSPTRNRTADGDVAELSGRAATADDRDAAPASATNRSDARSADGDPLTDSEQRELARLERRDARVRAHEQAHVAAAGELYRGGPDYTFEVGPDGRRYAVGGSVSIDTSSVDGDPAATIRKAMRIKQAALAPADPSSADRAIAAKAARMAAQAERELARSRVAQQPRAATPAAPDRSPQTRDASQTSPSSNAPPSTRASDADEATRRPAAPDRAIATPRSVGELIPATLRRSLNDMISELGVPAADLYTRPTDDLYTRPTDDLYTRPTDDLYTRPTDDLYTLPSEAPMSDRIAMPAASLLRSRPTDDLLTAAGRLRPLYA